MINQYYSLVLFSVCKHGKRRKNRFLNFQPNPHFIDGGRRKSDHFKIKGQGTEMSHLRK